MKLSDVYRPRRFHLDFTCNASTEPCLTKLNGPIVSNSSSVRNFHQTTLTLSPKLLPAARKRMVRVLAATVRGRGDLLSPWLHNHHVGRVSRPVFSRANWPFHGCCYISRLVSSRDTTTNELSHIIDGPGDLVLTWIFGVTAVL